MTTLLTREKTRAHEALYPALERLTHQLEAMAVRRPGAPVPEAARATASDLLFEAQRFGGGRRTLVEPAADIGGLAIQLGRALARLDAFEAANTVWHPEQGCFVWQLRDLPPIRRLRPETRVPLKTPAQSRAVEELRRKIAARLAELSAGS